MTLILNTLIYADDHANGISQMEMVDRIATLGADGVELRREYFGDASQELPKTARHAIELGLTVNYSVPDVLFLEDGQFNPKIAQYYQEGLEAGIAKIKFNVGHFEKFTGNLAQTLGKLTASIETNVENDQSVTSGTIAPLLTFLRAAQDAELDIKYVYDMGNWAFVNQDALEAAQNLAPYTRYIHLKNTAVVSGKLMTPADLNFGLYNWQQLLEALPHDVQMALEYPMKRSLNNKWSW